MKKIITASLLLFFSLFSLSEDLLLMSCDHKASMTQDMLTKVLKHRDSAFNTCLSCQGSSCSMKTWQDKEKNNELICKRLFCTPNFISHGYVLPGDTPSGKSSFTYTYNISQEGLLTNINILEVTGVYSKRDAKKFLKALTRKTKYEPIIFQKKS
ncbi:MAG TPA: hypothetical protein QF379_05870, partial [SAR86 cluster bacterium]|nr:hypothetical protein [SAR86 cluster bacterium]